MRVITNKWVLRWLQATRVQAALGVVRMTALRDDIEALADSLFRAGYPAHPDIELWVVRVNKAVSSYNRG